MIKLEELTRREREVLALVKERRKNQEIAQLLDITEYTINKHMTNIMRKLHVHNRMKAVEAYESGQFQ